MSMTGQTDAEDVPTVSTSRMPSTVVTGLCCALALMGLAMLVPYVAGWDVRIAFPPLFARWLPRVGPGTLPAVLIAVLGVGYAYRVCLTITWPRLLLVSWLTGLGWLVSLALVDGRSGLSSHIDSMQLLQAARETTDVSQTLHTFVSRIPLGPDEWTTHVAGHPAGALLFFVLLVRLGLGGSLLTGLVITLLASTIPLATLITLRTLGAERLARLAAPFVVLAPAAIWQAVSGDAVYACLAAWGLTALALGAVRRSIISSIVAGLLLGVCVEMSYGLPLLGILALGVLLVARSFRPVGWAVAAAMLVVGAFWIAGFSLVAAYPALHDRYWAGIASLRPASYWLWADLAALCFSAGPMLGAGVACWVRAVRQHRSGRCTLSADQRVVAVVGGAALVSVAVADLSLMSKAEVERIWLPFIPWMLILCSLLPPRWRAPGLAVQVVTALLVQHFLLTGW